MSKITDASATQILFAEETEYGKLPNPFNAIEFGINSQGLAPNIATVESEELNLNPDVIDEIISGVDAGGDLMYEACEGAGMKKILEHAFRGSFKPYGTPAINRMKSGAEDKSMSILKRFSSENGDFPFLYSGSRLNTLSFDITADGGIITSTANFMSLSEKFLGNFGMFHVATGVPSNSLGNVGDIAVVNSTQYVYYKTDVEWIQIMNPINTANPFSLGDVQKVYVSDSANPPTTTPNTGIILYLSAPTGQFYISDGEATNRFYEIEGLNMYPDMEGIWRYGTSLPSPTIGSYGDYYIVTADADPVGIHAGKVFQKMSREVDSDWTQVGVLFNSTFDPYVFYYYGMTVVPKSYKTKMNIPQFKNIVMLGEGASGKYCFTDLGFTVENNCENVKGLCTENVDYPWLSAVQTKYGNRVITGNATILFNSVELYEDFFKKNKTLSIAFSMENGQGYGWKFIFPKVKFYEGSIDTGGKGDNITIPLKWKALYDNVEGCACIVEEIRPENRASLTAPVAYGASMREDDTFRADWSYIEVADGYVVQLASDVNFENIVSEVVIYDDTSMSQVFSGLDDNTDYYFRVKSTAFGGLESSWSNVIPTSTRITPNFIDPAHLVVKQDDNGTGNGAFVAWGTEVEGATGYKLYVSTDSAFGSMILDGVETETPSYDVQNLVGQAGGRNYYFKWIVEGAKDENESRFSNLGTVTIGLITP